MNDALIDEVLAAFEKHTDAEAPALQGLTARERLISRAAISYTLDWADGDRGAKAKSQNGAGS